MSVPNKPWRHDELAQPASSITWEHVVANPDKPWDYASLSTFEEPIKVPKYWAGHFEGDNEVRIRARSKLLKEELVQAVFHPDRAERMGGPDWLDALD